ncbi:MAG: hypothetical protein U0R78_07885 [Nocardioidaceae bacterium]
MGQHVVHLARDARSLVGPGLQRPQALLASARSARWWSAATSSRREPTYIPQPMTIARKSTPKMMLTQKGESSVVGMMSVDAASAVVATTPTGMISRHRRRVASENIASMPGAVLSTENMPSEAITTGTATGQRRRKCTSTNAPRPTATSIQNSQRSSRHSSGTEPTSRMLVSASMTSSRQVCPHHVTGGWKLSGAVRSTMTG